MNLSCIWAFAFPHSRSTGVVTVFLFIIVFAWESILLQVLFQKCCLSQFRVFEHGKGTRSPEHRRPCTFPNECSGMSQQCWHLQCFSKRELPEEVCRLITLTPSRLGGNSHSRHRVEVKNPDAWPSCPGRRAPTLRRRGPAWSVMTSTRFGRLQVAPCLLSGSSGSWHPLHVASVKGNGSCAAATEP